VTGPSVGAGTRVLLVDHQDSFVHTLGNYLRQTGADVTTLRYGFPIEDLERVAPNLIVLSPGPGRPSDFDVSCTLATAIDRTIPVFGVCLGLQAMVEHFGGELELLDYPMHGKTSWVRLDGGCIFEGMPDRMRVGRYHSLVARREAMPQELCVTAESEDGVIMAIEHRTLPLAAVQFHPESIMTLEGNLGLQLIENVVARLAR
jgi:anthranilate synthase